MGTPLTPRSPKFRNGATPPYGMINGLQNGMDVQSAVHNGQNMLQNGQTIMSNGQNTSLSNGLPQNASYPNGFDNVSMPPPSYPFQHPLPPTTNASNTPYYDPNMPYQQ